MTVAAGCFARGRGRQCTAAVVLVAAIVATPVPARGQTILQQLESIGLTGLDLAVLSINLGVIAFAVLVAITLLRTRERFAASKNQARARLSSLKARLDRAEALLGADAGAMVIWPPNDGRPVVETQASSSSSLPDKPAELLAFGRWLDAPSAATLDAAVNRLRLHGEPLDLLLKSRGGGHVEAEGRTGGSQVMLRLRDVAESRTEAAELATRHRILEGAHDSASAMVEALAHPAWVTDQDGRLVTTNTAYAEAVGQKTPEDAVASQAMLMRARRLDPDLVGGDLGVQTLSTPDGARRFQVSARNCGAGVAFVAVDVEDAESAAQQIRMLTESHGRTLAQLKTGVAVVDADGRLVFHNPAFREIWQLEPQIVDNHPTFADVLDHLRTEGRLPEIDRDYRRWREKFLSRDGAFEVSSDSWHLPDGQTLRVGVDPQPDGGMIYLFENVTESVDLQTRYVALSRVQRETIDSLFEGIAVFGSDGRLKLYNPTFASQWNLPDEAFEGRPHIDDVIAKCRAVHDDPAIWRRLKGTVTGVTEERRPFQSELLREDGKVLEMSSVPLPDGGTLAVFVDVTAARQIERALRDRNEALMRAAKIRNDFVHKVSYELRSPLTNIIGFGQLLSSDEIGPLNPRQHEYAGYILSSSTSLLAIINDILDLATIDAGVMELEIGEVSLPAAIDSAADGLRDRINELGIKLDIVVDPDTSKINADEKRLRQIVFNLLSNAIGFSDPGGAVRVETKADGDRIRLSVQDHGRGIDPAELDQVFERFESRTDGSRHRGVGLGLNMVKSLVELHGGKVEIESEPGLGTTVTCLLPVEPPDTPGDPDKGQKPRDQAGDAAGRDGDEIAAKPDDMPRRDQMAPRHAATASAPH